MYNIIYSYIVSNNGHGYSVLEHLTCCLGAYALQYYCKLEVAYNKYYLKHTMVINLKMTFIMVKRNLDASPTSLTDSTISLKLKQ
jgi:hypothetical protein